MSRLIEVWQELQHEARPESLAGFYTALAITAHSLEVESNRADIPELESVMARLIQFDQLLSSQEIDPSQALALGRAYLAIDPEEPLTIQAEKANQHLEHILGTPAT